METTIRTLAALGDIVLPSEMRGDLVGAARIAAAESAVDGELARQLVAIRAGLPGQALRVLTPLAEDPSLSVRERRWAEVLRAYASLHAWHLLPGGGGPLWAENEPGNRGTLLADLATIRRREFQDAVAGDPELEPHRLLAADVVEWFSDVDGPLTASGTTFQGSGESAAELGVEWELPDLMRTRLTLAGQANVAAVRHYAEGCLAKLAFRLGEPAAERMLATLTERAAADGDDIGVVACLLRRASWLLAPLGGAAVFDLAVADSGQAAITTATTPDAVEGTGRSEDHAAAQDLVDEAAGLLDRLGERSDLRCAVGAVALYRSFLAFRRGEYAEQAAYATAAEGAYERAGDHYGRHLAGVHQIAAAIGSGSIRAGERRVHEIADWALRDGSFSWGFGLGLLLGRLGRHWQVRVRDPQRARAAYSRAKELFQALDAPRNTAQVAADLAGIDGLLGMGAEELSAYEEAIGHWRAYAAKWPDEKAYADLAVIQTVMNANVAASRYGDPDLMDRAIRLAESIGEPW